MNAWLSIAAVVTAALSGALTLWSARDHNRGQRLAAAMQLLAAGLGGTAAVRVLAGDSGGVVQLALSPLLPQLGFGLDPLSALFLLPVCLLCGAASVFDLAYWRQSEHQDNGRQLRLFLGVLFASLMLVLLAQDGVALLMAWEIMALAGFFLIATEHQLPTVRDAAWVYLAATHAGTLLLVALFCCWQQLSGSFALLPLPDGGGDPLLRDAVFVLALLGFGMKAGIVPLHFWLPPAHANAPSHVSAVMSGVLIKMGIYGIARTCWLMPQPPIWWGELLLLLGAVSAVVGVAFAIGQHDLKRLLAYHSIENIGIICLGLGLAMLGRATGRLELLALGLGGGLLHVWNHGMFKGLLFLAAGATIHRTGTREIDQLGGVGKAMPFTAACFLVGAVAICGLPPLNGFVSELLTYLGLFAALGDGGPLLVAMVAIPALALVGAMALLCFVKVFGVVYLGAPRSAAALRARPAEGAMRLPMAALVLGCCLIGLLPALALPALQRVINDWTPASATAPLLASLAPFAGISRFGLLFVAITGISYVWLGRRRDPAQARVGTWDCGYVDASSPRLQYTAGSFAQQFVDQTRMLLWPREHRPRLEALFPAPQHHRDHVPDLVLDRLLRPALQGLGAACNWLRRLQRGRVQLYLLYVFLTLILLLLRK